MNKIVLGSVLSTVFLIACATIGERMSRVREGMSKAEVIDTLGNPDGFKREGDFEALKYSHRLASGWAMDRADYYVILKNGMVVEYGAGEIRVKDSGGTIVLVPLP